MIKTLKSELKLRPTYDEMIGMIEAQGNENRPSIETVIDRRATLFRNNQFGSQLDNIDFLGLKKQEEDRAKEDVRRAQLRQRGITAGVSTGIISVGASDFSTPAEVYEMETDEEGEGYLIDGHRFNIRTELEEGLRRQEQARQRTTERARSDLDEAHSQSIPAGVEMYRMDTGGTDEVDDEDIAVYEDDVNYTPNIRFWGNKPVEYIQYQFFLRGIEVPNRDELSDKDLYKAGTRNKRTYKDYLLDLIEDSKDDGAWTEPIDEEEVKERKQKWKMKKGRGKGSGISSSLAPSQPASSSSTTKDILVSGAKAGVETLAKAGATALAKSFLPV